MNYLWASSGIQIHFEGWNLSGALVLLGIIALLAVLTLTGKGSFSRQRSAPENGPPAVADPAAPAGKPVLKVSPDANGMARPTVRTAGREKRVWLRRKGNPVPVLLLKADGEGTPGEGAVLDRSRGGLLIAGPWSLSPGEGLFVLPVNAPEEVTGIPVQVRHCRQKDGQWLFGCAFTQELPWNVLALFG